jgi:hypothetical protein
MNVIRNNTSTTINVSESSTGVSSNIAPGDQISVDIENGTMLTITEVDDGNLAGGHGEPDEG